MTILKQINRERQEFESESIQIVPGYFFNQKETIDKVYRYYNSQFLDGDIDVEGNKKYFYNIVRNPCKVTTKAIDFDTKNINVQTAAGGDPLRTWFFERDLKFWMKDKNFGKVLNRIFEELPKLGSVVLKVIKGTPHFVDLRNFIVEQSADSLSQANYIVERHLYSPVEFKKVAKDLKWDNADTVLEEHRKTGEPYIAVFERYGEIEDDSGNFEYKRVMVADVGVDEKDMYGDTINYPGIDLEEEVVETHPYWEFHMEKMPGRWLGQGIIEVLFDAQVRMNEIANLQAKGSYWAASRIFQTLDEGVNKNLRSDVRDGDVLNVESEITQVNLVERNLAFFNQETVKWTGNRDELTFSYDVIQGERLPAGTPLGSARLAAAMAGSHFDQIQENVALAVKEFLYKVIIPEFEKKNSGEHILRLVGEDLDKLNNLLVAQKTSDRLIGFIAKKRKFPTKENWDLIKTVVSEKIKRGQEKLVKIPMSFYDNLKYKIDIIITGEQRDSAVYSQTLFAILQAMTADPTVLTDPTKRKVFFRIAESGGVNLMDILPDEDNSVQKLAESIPQQRGGGGVSRPQAVGLPQMARTEQKV